MAIYVIMNTEKELSANSAPCRTVKKTVTRYY